MSNLIQEQGANSYFILAIYMYVWFSSLKKDSSSLSETATYISTLTAQRMCHPLRAYCLIRCRPIRTGLWLLAIRLATRRAHRIRAQPTSSLRKPTWDQDNHHRYYNDLIILAVAGLEPSYIKYKGSTIQPAHYPALSKLCPTFGIQLQKIQTKIWINSQEVKKIWKQLICNVVIKIIC